MSPTVLVPDNQTSSKYVALSKARMSPQTPVSVKPTFSSPEASLKAPISPWTAVPLKARYFIFFALAKMPMSPCTLVSQAWTSWSSGLCWKTWMSPPAKVSEMLSSLNSGMFLKTWMSPPTLVPPTWSSFRPVASLKTRRSPLTGVPWRLMTCICVSAPFRLSSWPPTPTFAKFRTFISLMWRPSIEPQTLVLSAKFSNRSLWLPSHERSPLTSVFCRQRTSRVGKIENTSMSPTTECGLSGWRSSSTRLVGSSAREPQTSVSFRINLCKCFAPSKALRIVWTLGTPSKCNSCRSLKSPRSKKSPIFEFVMVSFRKLAIPSKSPLRCQAFFRHNSSRRGVFWKTPTSPSTEVAFSLNTLRSLVFSKTSRDPLTKVFSKSKCCKFGWFSRTSNSTSTWAMQQDFKKFKRFSAKAFGSVSVLWILNMIYP